MQREKQIHEIEVHVAGLCVSQEGDNARILIGKRAEDRQIFPGYWECGGGQVHKGETFVEAVEFHMEEEFGLTVEVVCPFWTYKIELKDKVSPGIRFICKPKPSQKVRIDHEELVDYRWISEAELETYDLIPGLKADIARGMEVYHRLGIGATHRE